MATQFTNDQAIDTVNEFLAENPDFDTYYDDNAGFQAWKKEGQNIISFCTTRQQAFKKLEKLMYQAVNGDWSPRR